VTFKSTFLGALDANPDLPDGMKAFLALGDHRNRLVHNNFADLTTDQTVEDVYSLFGKAQSFVDHLCAQLLA
jgi:hypothetical protein